MPNCVALIPARGGSKRIKAKNTRSLAGKPLLAYSIASALESKIFHKVIVSSDDIVTLGLAQTYGADIIRRPDEYATDTSPDIDFVQHALRALAAQGNTYDHYSILRPTSPFRTAALIQAAYSEWQQAEKNGFTSLRTVEPVGQHPAKMWVRQPTKQITPLLLQPEGQKWHDSQRPTLPDLYVQNACIEFSKPEIALEQGTISGDSVYGYIMEGVEGHDLNTEEDWKMAEKMVVAGAAVLPEVG